MNLLDAASSVTSQLLCCGPICSWIFSRAERGYEHKEVIQLTDDAGCVRAPLSVLCNTAGPLEVSAATETNSITVFSSSWKWKDVELQPRLRILVSCFLSWSCVFRSVSATSAPTWWRSSTSTTQTAPSGSNSTQASTPSPRRSSPSTSATSAFWGRRSSSTLR